MTDPTLQDILRDTLEDARLSRSERRALRAVLSDRALDRKELLAVRDDAFELARESLGQQSAKQVLDWLERVVRTLEDQEPEPEAPSLKVEAAFSPGDTCRARISRLFEDAHHSADVCVFTITDNRLAQSILDAHRRGVKIRILTDDDKSTDLGSDIRKLGDLGIEVRTDHSPNHMHHKFAVFDRSVLLTGSYNWTRSAAAHNQENVVILREPSVVRAFLDEYERLWRQFE